MKNFLIHFTLLFGLWLISSCAEEQPENDELLGKSSSFYIEFGTECGWCAGHEFIKVTELKVEYTRTIPCGDDMGTTTNSRELADSEWEQLLKTFNNDEFTELNHNTCNLCVDGCDEIIRIGDADTAHQIRYTPGEDIESIKILQEKLNNLMQEFSQDN